MLHRAEGQSHDPTLDFWESRAAKKLSEEDSREIIENASGFFRILLQWARAGDASRKRVNSESGTQSTISVVAHGASEDLTEETVDDP